MRGMGVADMTRMCGRRPLLFGQGGPLLDAEAVAARPCDKGEVLATPPESRAWVPTQSACYARGEAGGRRACRRAHGARELGDADAKNLRAVSVA